MSKYTVHPVEFQIEADSQLMAKVIGFDSESCHVEIKQVMGAGDWPKLSEAIQKALTAYVNRDGL